ncbi:uncharacterized protein LOC135808291 [Sycon ciliatum]|uniref:uncharacterized protein LOC135808291 n=1 Tax=Sycon ciliatum TaxID=27933 RepID=UPI0031F64878
MEEIVGKCTGVPTSRWFRLGPSCVGLYWLLALALHGIGLSFSRPIHVGYFGMEDNLLSREYWSAFGVALTEANRTAPDGVSYSFSRVWASSINSTNCSLSAEQLVNDNVEVVVSTANSYCTAQALPLFETNGIAVLAALASSSSVLSRANDGDFLFQLAPSDQVQGRAIAAVMDYYNWTSMSSIAVNSFGSSDIVTGIRNTTTGSQLAFGVDLHIPSNETNIELSLESAFSEVYGIGTGINLLDVSDVPNSNIAFTAIFREPRVTGEGWQWIASSQAAVALGQTPIGSGVRLYTQGALAVVPKYADLSSGIWQNFTQILASEHMFASGLATCSILPDSRMINLPFRAQVVDSVLLIQQAVGMQLSANATQLQADASVRRRAILDQLLRINSPARGIIGSAGHPVYFTSDRMPAVTNQEVVIFDSNVWLSIGSWTASSGYVPNQNQTFVWPGFSSQIPTEIAPGYRPRFKIGFLYLSIEGNDSSNTQDNALGREYLSAFNVSVRHIEQNTSALVLFDPYPMAVDTDEDCADAAQKLADMGVHVVIGGYRSNCSIAAATVLGRQDVMVAQVSYGSTVETLSNTDLYPWFLRVVPPDSFQGTAIAELVQRFGWSKVALLYTENNIYAEGLRSSFERAANGTLLNSTQITVVRAMPNNINTNENADQIIDDALNEIIKQDTQVVLLVVYSSLAERIVQRGSRSGGPEPADGWIWVGTDSSTAFEPQAEDVRDAVTGMVGTRPKGGEGYVFLQLLSEWLQLNRTYNPGTVFNIAAQPQPYVPELFDAVMAVELALSDLVNSKRVSQLTPLRDVRNKVFNQLLSYNSAERGFFGSIGSTIYFDSQRNGPAEYDIVNFQGGQWRKVGDWIRSRAVGSRLNLELLTVLPSGQIATERESPPTFEVLYVDLTSGSDEQLTKQLGLVRRIALQYLANNQRTYAVRLNVTVLIPKGSTEDCGRIVSESIRKQASYSNRFGYVAVMGLIQSACAISVSNTLQAEGIKIPLISFGATSSDLSNKTSHPYFFRTCPGDNNQADVARDLVARYNWTKIGIIGTSDPYGSGLARSVFNAVQSLGNVLPGNPILFEPGAKLSVVQEKIKQLRNGNTAVNFISAFTDDTRTVLRAAEINNMLGPGWTWLGGDGMTALQFNSTNQVSVQSLVGSSLIIGNGSVFDFLSERYTAQAGVLGITPRNNVVFLSGRSVSVPLFASQLFDSVTVLAYSLSQLWNSSAIINIQYDSGSVDRNAWLTTTRMAVVRRLRNTTDPPVLLGAMGLPVMFTAEQDGPAAYNVLNYFGSQWQVVGEHVNRSLVRQQNSTNVLLTISRDIVWSGGVVTPHGSDPPSDPGSSSSRNEIIAFVIIGAVLACGVGLLLFHAVRKTRGTESMATFSPVN